VDGERGVAPQQGSQPFERRIRSAKGGANQLEKRRRNLLDDVHLTALKNRFVIQLNDALFDAGTPAVEARPHTP
jgi:hypothetical protein